MYSKNRYKKKGSLLSLFIVSITIVLLCSCSNEDFVYSDLSTNKISFKAIASASWSDGNSNSSSAESKISRAVCQSNEHGPIIVKSELKHALYLHPVTQIGIHILNSKDKPVTKSGTRILDESTETVVPTRGAPYVSANMINSFGVLAYRIPSTATDVSGTAPDFINNQQVSTSGSIWKTGADYFWPDNGDKLSFFAYTPFGNNDVTVASASSTGTPSITYTANTDVTKQPDLMVAKTLNQTRNTISIAAGVDMSFSHALTVITFAVGKDMVPGVFKSLSIKNAITTATYNLSTNTWNTSSGTSTGNMTINLNGTTGITIDGTSDVALTSGTTTMMMIPQTFASGSTAVIEAVFNNGNGDKTLTASLAGTIWNPGTSIIYKLSTSSVNTMTLGAISYPSSWGGTVAPVSSFNSGEAVGIYVVDQNNNIKNSNVKATYNGSSWILDNNILFSPQYKYFVYYPYKSSQTSSVTAAATTADAFFNNLISGWSVTANQNTTSDFKGNDLQVAMGTISNTASSITFDMAHKMGLAVITLGTKSVPTTRTYTGGNSTYSDSSDKTIVTASSNFSGNQPLLYNNKYYYIAKAGSGTTFNSITADNDAWSAPLSATISSGSYSALTATNTSRTFYKFIANFNYTGAVQSFTIPLYGTSKFECWGAQGSCGGVSGNFGTGGNGGYARGYTNLVGSSALTIVIGGQGSQSNVFPSLSPYTGGYNGGGNGQEGGGGATHIASYNRGLLSNYVNNQSEVYIVAGGGGGPDGGDNGGAGGGSNGGNGIDIPNTYNTQGYGYGGTQSEGGIGGNKGTFGRGGNSYDSGTDSCGGGGGGWYGGGGGKDVSSPGGGGSGYIGGVSSGYMDSGVREGNGYAVITWIP
ncbi:fimbrillin family protein [Prevotella herbatica]|nr:fimbrillin family protein [Prevotella herbatica]